ncbi:CpaF family protein [Candidatus Micrarchaeota archaeon]|nr:CpaF family protein [Candidatus Micrarchaeota archaeon]
MDKFKNVDVKFVLKLRKNISDGALRMALGWCVKDEKVDYPINLPVLTSEEEEVVLAVADLFKELAKYEEFESEEETREKIRELLEEYCVENQIVLDEDQEEYLVDIATSHVYGFAFFDQLLKDPNIEEIGVIGINKPVYVYVRNKGWQQTNGYLTTVEYAIDLINKMSRQLGRRITYQSPRLNAILPDGSRLHASIPPISKVEITIRKFRENPFTVFDLLRFHTVSPEALSVIWLLMQSDLSVIVAGNTASGKTTTLNALFSFVPLWERILITEETPEINIPHKHKVNLVANEDLGVTISSLVADSLRMRPDRVIVGEVRTAEEVNGLIDTILSGQARGSYATFHAQSSVEALRRMHSLGVLEFDLQSIDLIIIQRRMVKYDVKTRESKEIRRIIEIAEVDKSSLMKTKPLFKYDFEKDRWTPNYSNSFLIERVRRVMGLTKAELKEELRRRTEFLKSNIDKGWDFARSVEEIQKFAYGKSGKLGRRRSKRKR